MMTRNWVVWLMILLFCSGVLMLVCSSSSRDEYNNEERIGFLDKFYKEKFHRYPDPIIHNYYRSMDHESIKVSLEAYAEEVEHGQSVTVNQRLVIAGLLRNQAHQIPFLKHVLGKLGGIFKDVAFVIVENDSTDKSREMLLEWSTEDPRVIVLCDNIVVVNQPSCQIRDIDYNEIDAMPDQHSPDSKRIERLAFLRNIYMQYIRNDLELQTFDYLMVMDLDIFGSIMLDGVHQTFSLFDTDPTIDAIGCNGIVMRPGKNLFYYDSFAYTEPRAAFVWRTRKEKTRHDAYVNKKISQMLLKNINLIPVFSAFGGLVFYRMQSVLHPKIKYDFAPDAYACEHSFFHRNIPHMYINPRLIFLITE